ncbi:MAG: CoA pyrophosphatase [bacterium]|nr:CoA pyrophosphatase [bacterium]
MMTNKPMPNNVLKKISLDDVRAALTLSEFDVLAAQGRMAPHPRGKLPQNEGQPAREAGVLALIYPEADGELHIVLTLRTDKQRDHSGQVSFPGGKRDPEDVDFAATALRETCEEIGVCSGITILGELSSFYIPPSHFFVHPVVGYTDTRPAFTPNPDEVAEVFGCALRDLLDEQFRFEEYREFNGYRVRVPYYDICGHKVWGATAAMLSELEARLQAALALRDAVDQVNE